MDKKTWCDRYKPAGLCNMSLDWVEAYMEAAHKRYKENLDSNISAICSAIENDPRVEITNPNGMRPGKYSIDLGGIWIHYLDCSDGYDSYVYVTYKNCDVYSITLNTANIIYKAETHYNGKPKEEGRCSVDEVLHVLRGDISVFTFMAICGE